VGSLLKPVPPVRRLADVVRHVVQRMGELGVVGNGLIARMVTRAGWRLSKRSSGRMRKEPRVPEPRPARPRAHGRVVAARRPNHVLMLDVTEIPVLFRIFTVKLVLAIDVWSGMPLGARVLPKEPTAAEVSELFQDVVARHGHVSHLVTDQGPQFTAEDFRQAVMTRGTRQRFGAVGRTGSIAIIERLFRTLKDALRQPLRPDVTLEDHRRRIDATLLWYSWHRPHMAIGGATPAEVYLGLRPSHLDARSPPRGRRWTAVRTGALRAPTARRRPSPAGPAAPSSVVSDPQLDPGSGALPIGPPGRRSGPAKEILRLPLPTRPTGRSDRPPAPASPIAPSQKRPDP